MADDTNAQVLLKLSAIDNLTPVMLKALQGMQDNSAKMVEAFDRVSDASTKTGAASDHAADEHAHQALSFIALKEAAEVVYEVYEKLEAQFEKAIEEALAGEAATNKLNGALISTGQYTPEAAEELEKYADTLAKTTGANVETTKSILGSGLQMGLSVEKSEALEAAARKLALQMGGDTVGAARMLESSLAGQSRGLAKLFPQLKDMTTGQLMQGDAIAFVSQALDAQYQLYQGSFAQGLEKAKTSINEVYKEFGNIIINSPLAKDAVNAFADVMMHVADTVKAVGDYLKEHSATIEAFAAGALKAAVIVGGLTAAYLAMNIVIPFAVAVWGALTTSVGLYGVAGTIAANATALLDAGLALLLSPITLTIGAVVLLTAAFYKWPGLFDVLIGGIKALLGIAILPMTAALGALTIGVGAVVSIFNKDWGNAIQNAGKSMIEMNANLIKNGAAQVQMGAASVMAGKQVEDSAAKAKKANEDAARTTSARAAAALAAEKVYDGFTYGTLKQRQALVNQAGDRDKDLKDFTAYLDAKERLAISKAEEQEIQVNAIRSKALGGGAGAGASGASAEAQVAIDTETKKQATLSALKAKGVLDDTQYQQALLASQQRSARAELVQAQANQAELNTILGLTPGAAASKLALQSQIDAQQIAQMRQSGTAAGATAAQLDAEQLRMKQQFYQQRVAAEKQFDTQEIALATAQAKHIADLEGNSPAGQQAKIQLANQQFLMELQQKKAHAQQEGLSQVQIDAMVQSENQQHLASMKQMKEKFIEDDLQQNQELGNNWQVSLDQIALSQEKFGTVMGTLRGVQQTEEYNGVMGALNNLASLRNSKSKSAFEVGKAAAIAGATVQTALSATEAFSSLAAIPFVGPALGAAAAAAAIAAGVINIQQISSQSFNPGGQADSGMDSVPAGLNGKSFILSQGERVVQPTANTDLTDFLAKQKSGSSTGSAGGQTIQINLTYSGSMSKEDVKGMADMLVKEIRDRSNRGQPIMSPKGLTST